MTARGADRLKAALLRRHPAPAWLLAFEVPPAAGFELVSKLGARSTARADAIAFSLFPSLGHELIGYEFKANRRDWHRELEDTTKAAPFLQLVDQWWVASLPGVIQMSEVPNSWGWLVLPVGSQRLVSRKPAPSLNAGGPGRDRPIDRSFAAILFQRARRAGLMGGR